MQQMVTGYLVVVSLLAYPFALYSFALFANTKK
jgi:hypothetical protein